VTKGRRGLKSAPAQVAPEVGRERLDADAKCLAESVRESIPDAHQVEDVEHGRVSVAALEECERVVRGSVRDRRVGPRQLRRILQRVHVGVLRQPL